MNSEKQDGFFGRIRMTAESDERVKPSATLSACTLFTYSESPSSFFIAKLSYFLFICVLIFGAKVTEGTKMMAMPITALLLVVLFLPLLVFSFRSLFSKTFTADGMFASLFGAFFLILNRPLLAIGFLFVFHVFDTVSYLLLYRATAISFTPIPLTPMKFVHCAAPGKCSIGDTIILTQGDFVPADGRVVSGECSADSKAFLRDRAVFRVGDLLRQGFVLTEGSVQITLTALPSSSYFSLYRSRVSALMYDALFDKKRKRHQIAFSSLLSLAGAVLTLLSVFRILAPHSLYPFVFVLAGLSLSCIPRVMLCFVLRALKECMRIGFIPATSKILTDDAFPFEELLDLALHTSPQTDDAFIAVKSKGEARCLSSESSPLQYMAAKRHCDTTLVALTVYSTEGLSEGASVFHQPPSAVLPIVKSLHCRLGKKLLLFRIIDLLLLVSALSLAALTHSTLLLLLPFGFIYVLVFLLSFLNGRKMH